MSHTPAVTPSRAKNLPLIVDIAIDNDGKQLYQVHESAKAEHKDMPRTATGFEKAEGSSTYTQSEGNTVYTNLSLQSDENGPLKSEVSTARNNVANLDLSYSDHASAINYKQDANHQLSLTSETSQDFQSLSSGKLGIPVKKELDNLSPTSLEREPSKFDSYQPPQYYPYPSQGQDTNHHVPVGSYQQQPQQAYYYDSDALNGYGQSSIPTILTSGNSGAIASEYRGSLSEQQNSANLILEGGSKAPESDIWSDDVSEAFEEILAIIPKNGLNKIKISGRSCGRNELISDYILTKTGKHRSRKQVSSHIQVIKNLGQKQNIIKLIKDGPVFNTEEERIANSKKFEAIFSKINLNKSLGLNDNTMSAPRGPSSSGQGYSRKRSFEQLQSGKRQKTAPARQFAISNFFISLYDDYNSSPITLCIQKDNGEFQNLKLKGDANISTRFPGLLQFQDCNIPIIHTMVNLKYPSHVASPEFFEKGLKTNISVQELNYLSASDGALSVFSSVYSYGNEVLKFNEENFMLGKNHPFLHKFWLFYLSKLVGKSDGEVATALKSLTIKQIIFVPSKKQANSGIIPKLRIRAVLLWEFASATDLSDATTVSTKLLLPSVEALPLSYTQTTDREQPSMPLSHQFPPEHPASDPHGGGIPVTEYIPGNQYLPGGINYTTVPTGYAPPGPTTSYYEQPLGASGIQGSNQFQVQSKFQNLQEVANQTLSTRSASYPTVQQPLQHHFHLPLQAPPPPAPPPAQSLQPQMMPASFDNVAAMPMAPNDVNRYPHPSAKVDLMAATSHQPGPQGDQQVLMPEAAIHQGMGADEVPYHSPPHKEPIRNLAEDGSGYKPVYYPDTYVSDLS